MFDMSAEMQRKQQRAREQDELIAECKKPLNATEGAQVLQMRIIKLLAAILETLAT